MVFEEVRAEACCEPAVAAASTKPPSPPLSPSSREGGNKRTTRRSMARDYTVPHDRHGRRNDASQSSRRPTVTSRGSVAQLGGGGGRTLRCGPHEYRLGLYGWRRRCLYGLVLLLLVIVIVNLALTLFILRVLDISSSGMGGLQIVNGGVIANGNVFIMDTLVAARITSRPHAPIRILAAHNITLAATAPDGEVKSSLYVADTGLEFTSDHLMIRDPHGRVLFSATKEEVLVGSKRLTVTGEGGAVLSGSIQTGHVAAHVGESLMLESATRNLEVLAPQGIALESRAGSIKANCLDDFTLQSTGGMIKFDTPHIFVKGLPTSTVQTNDANQVRPDVYQVCVCSGGKIFLAVPGGVCAATHDFCK